METTEKQMESKLEVDSNFTQLCVWPACTLSGKPIEEFIQFMLKNFNARIKFMEEVNTLPGDGGEGGRIDLFFYVHSEDVGKFAIPRLKAGIRWWEDVIDNMRHHGDQIYSQEILDKYPKTW